MERNDIVWRLWRALHNRHTHTTMLAENDVPPKYLQTRMGHVNLQVTMKVYLHITEKISERGDEILQKMFSSGESKEDE